MRIRPVILSGGSGTRLWPLSRGMYPKQFLPLVDETKSMLQQTLDRMNDRSDCLEPIIVCNEEHRFIVAEQLLQNGNEDVHILLEPEGRNTAPAIALAALLADHLDETDLLLVMPADHVIEDSNAFNRAVDMAAVAARAGKLITFGIEPASPETGYGYIQAGEKTSHNGVLEVRAFHEKPDLPTAQSYLDAGSYLWNGGIFMFHPDHYLRELDCYSPDVVKACRKAFAGVSFDFDFVRVDQDAFKEGPSISVDHAVMEETANAGVVPLNAGWSDVGSWAALWDVSPKDENGNVSKGDVLIRSSKKI